MAVRCWQFANDDVDTIGNEDFDYPIRWMNILLKMEKRVFLTPEIIGLVVLLRILKSMETSLNLLEASQGGMS